MNKYKQSLLKNIKLQLDTWFIEQGKIQQIDLYRFLHSITGTATTIGLIKVGEEARRLMEQLDEKEQREWDKSLLQQFLFPLISVLYEEEYSYINEDIDRSEAFVNKKLILLFDDDIPFIMYLKDEIQQHGWVIIAVTDPARAVQSYYDLNPDAIIIHAEMGSNQGHDVLRKIKENIKQIFTPIIVMSHDISTRMRVDSYRLGADDFISMPLDLDEFTIRVHRHLERKQAIDEFLLIDELTGVYNRKYLKRSYDSFVNHFKEKQEPFCLAMLDVDHFKKVNDTYGHVTGDAVLAELARFLRTHVKLSDIIIRYGGEEFLLLLPDTKVKEAKEWLESLLHQFSKIPFEGNQGDSPFYCTFSAGVHEIRLEELDLKANLQTVDSALYDAKGEGRNRVKLVPVNTRQPLRKAICVGIVDDDPIIRTILKDLITKSNLTKDFALEIKAFKDGLEFYESKWFLENDAPYLMILDGVMPRMDGIEVLQKLRELPNQDRFTIMMLTTRKSEQDIARAIHLGADDYITKPFKLLELESRLGHLMKRMK